MEIVFSDNISFATIDNQYSDNNGDTVVCVTITIKNVSEETHGLNMFYYSIYCTAGTKLDDITAYFMDDDVSWAGDMRSGAEQTAVMHFLYDGDGNYYVEFNDWTNKVEVKLPVSK